MKSILLYGNHEEPLLSKEAMNSWKHECHAGGARTLRPLGSYGLVHPSDGQGLSYSGESRTIYTCKGVLLAILSRQQSIQDLLYTVHYTAPAHHRPNILPRTAILGDLKVD